MRNEVVHKFPKWRVKSKTEIEKIVPITFFK